MTTNPTIFAAALAEGERYDEQVRELAADGADVDRTVFALTTTDVRNACDVLRAGLRRHQRRRRPGLDRGRPRPRPRHRRDHRLGQGAVEGGRPAQPVHQDPGDHRGRPRDHRRARRGHQRQRHADLRPGALPGRHRRLPRRAREGAATPASTCRRSTRSRRSSSRASTPRSTTGSTRSAPTTTLRGKAGVANARLAYEAYEKFFSGDRWDAARRRRRQPAASAVGLDRREEPGLQGHDVRRRPGRREHRQHDAREDPARRSRTTARSSATRCARTTTTPAVMKSLADAGIDYDDVIADPREGGRREVRDVLARAARHRQDEPRGARDEGARGDRLEHRLRRRFELFFGYHDEERSPPPSSAGHRRRGLRHRQAQRDAVGPDAASEAGKRLAWVGLAEESRPLVDEIVGLRDVLADRGCNRVVLVRHGRLVARPRGHLRHRTASS